MGSREFGEYLRKLREAKRLSQFQLGKIIGVKDKAVSKWENGYSYPKNIYILRLSETLNVSTTELLSRMYQQE